ncbi:MAG: sporulation protein YqfD [Acutalibacteraceae bacterium]
MTHWLRYLLGWVEWRAEGGFFERFLNLAASKEIPLWHTRRQEIALLGGCYARHYRRLRPLARKSGVHLRVQKRHGWPFWARRYRTHSGLAVGAALMLAILHLLSQRVWVIDVRGNEAVPAEQIESVARELGVREGVRQEDIRLRDIQLGAIEKMPALSWISVNVEGCAAHIEVSERITADQPPDLSKPTNLKAARDGRIVAVRLAEGAATVKPGDAVAKGMLLASGIVETKNGHLLKHARGEVIARTERSFSVTVPLEETLPLPQTDAILQPTLEFFSLQIPLYTGRTLPNPYETRTVLHRLTANGVRLPIGVTDRYVFPIAPTLVRRTPSQAKEQALQAYEEWKRNELSPAAVLREQTMEIPYEDGFILSAKVECEENIAVEDPIRIHLEKTVEK